MRSNALKTTNIMVNINIELFRRTSPAKKYEMINNLTVSELFLIKPSTILRIIKEAGTGDSDKQRSKFKTLYLSSRVSNCRNSNVNSIYNWKKDSIYMSVYIQGYDTDTEVSANINLLRNSSNEEISFGKFEETYLHGNSSIINAWYNQTERAAIIREILRTYIINKYNYEL